MITWFTKNHVAANLLMVSILLMGIFSLKSQIPLEVFPSFESNVVTTSVSLPGATPQDIEQSVAVLIEEAVADLEGIEEITSRSVEGSTSVSMEIADNYDKRDLLADIKNRVDGISNFPEDAKNPNTRLNQFKREVISLSIAGDFSEKEIRQYGEKIRDDLLQRSGITQVDLDRVRNYQLSIDVKQDKLREYDLNLTLINNAIANSSLDLSAGNLRTSGGDILISSKGQRYDLADFKSIVIKSTDQGNLIRLGDIARIEDGFEEVPMRTRFNGQQAAMIEVYRVGDQNAIELADTVKEYIAEQQVFLPRGMTLSYWNDRSRIVKSRLKTLTDNAMQGGILVIILLSLFLRPSIAFFVFLGIPISFMGAFIVMPYLGITLNIISLFGFILVLGIVVDDAIVTGENIYRHMQRAESGLVAAITGTKEVSVAVTFGILTTVVAFLPFAFIDGRRGALFAQIPAIVIPVLLFSLIESKFILPAHLKMLKLRQAKQSPNRFSRWQQRFADGFENIIFTFYRPLLVKCLAYRYSLLSLFIGVLILLIAFISSGWMRFTFFPRVPSEIARVTLTMPSGTAFDVTDRHVKRMVDAALQLQQKYRNNHVTITLAGEGVERDNTQSESANNNGDSVIQNILSSTGSAGGSSHIGRVRFETLSPEERSNNVTMGQLVKEWRQIIGPIEGAQSVTYRAEIGRGGDPIDVLLSGNSYSQLQAAAADIRNQLATYPGVFDISDNLSDGKEELQIELKPQGHLLGISRADIIRQIRQSVIGIEIQRFQRGREEIPVVIRLPLSERDSIADLNRLEINGPNSRRVPLQHIAELSLIEGPSAVYRIDHRRTASVVADINKKTVNATVLNKDISAFLKQLKQRYPQIEFSLEGEAKEQRDSFGSLQWGLVFVFFAIYALLAIPFQSFLQPLIVMSIIPFSAIGAIFGHWLMGMDLTIMSLLGLLALIGVVVNDSLVLVSFVNQQLKDKAKTIREAVLEAGIARFRPVMLTSITTFAGLMPLLFEQATQAQFLIPMAVSLSFGIIFATLITLLLIPVNYMIIEDIRLFFNKPKNAKKHIDEG